MKKISIVLFIVAIILNCISLAIGLIPDFDYSVDKICMYLGFVFLGLGLVFLKKAKDNNDDK